MRKGFKDRPPRPRLERLEVLEQFRAARVKELTVNVLGDAPVERIGSGPTSYVKALRRAISIHEGDTPYRLQLAFSHANIKVKTSTQGLKLSDNFLQLIKDLAPGISGISYEL